MQFNNPRVLGPDEGDSMSTATLGVRFMIDGERSGLAHERDRRWYGEVRAQGVDVVRVLQEDETVVVLDVAVDGVQKASVLLP